MAARLLFMKDAFPTGLPPPPPDMPDWVSMDYNQFAAFFHLKYLGTFTIPLTNVNVHEGQRPEDLLWTAELQRRFADGIEAHAHPGVAVLNTEQLPLDEDGNVDPLQMRVSIISSQHCCAARLGMNEPQNQKVWVFRVHAYGILLLCLCYWFYID
jgi:hypothetical protein